VYCCGADTGSPGRLDCTDPWRFHLPQRRCCRSSRRRRNRETTTCCKQLPSSSSGMALSLETRTSRLIQARLLIRSRLESSPNLARWQYATNNRMHLAHDRCMQVLALLRARLALGNILLSLSPDLLCLLPITSSLAKWFTVERCESGTYAGYSPSKALRVPWIDYAKLFMKFILVARRELRESHLNVSMLPSLQSPFTMKLPSHSTCRSRRGLPDMHPRERAEKTNLPASETAVDQPARRP
jgi:hypothetical protein